MANTRKTKYVSLDGGTNLTTPILEIPEGDFIYTFNMEPNKTKGITSSRGYERIDGNNTNPSNAKLSIYKYESLTGTLPAQGDTITETGDNYTVCGIIQDTATTGTIYLLAETNIATVPTSFTTGDGDFTATHYRFIQRLQGSKFPPYLLSDIEKPFYDYAIETQRGMIAPVPGQGPVLGVAQDPNNGRLLAIRKGNATERSNSTTAITTSTITLDAGASAVDDYYFNMTVAIGTKEGLILAYNGTSKVATVDTDFTTEDTGSDGIEAYTITNTNDLLYEAIPTVGWTQITGTSFTNSEVYNFADITQMETSRRLYIANGVDPLHSYDSNGPTINTYDLTDTGTITFPLDVQAEFVVEHVGRVVAAGANKVIYSSTQTPTFTTPAAGTITQHTNYIITGLSKLVNNNLFVPTENSIYIQEGDPDSNSPIFGPFKEHTNKTGAFAYTTDSSDYPYFINKFGVSNLMDTLKSGDFEYTILSDKVAPIVNSLYNKDGTPVVYVGGFIDRERDIYRVYRSDGISFCMLKTKERGFPITFNDYKVGLQCIESYKDADKEYIIAGSGYDTNFAGNYSGYVYRMESGYSLDGNHITHSIKTPYLHFGSPAIRKRIFKYNLDILAPEKVTITYKADFNTGSSRYSQQLDLVAISGQSRFDQSSFDAATWSSNFIDGVGGYINGAGTNISLNVNVNTLNTSSFTYQGIIYHYKTRGLKR